MERFAIKIDKKLKANLYKICRLCGIDNPDMVPIISDKPQLNENASIDVEMELEMQQKINLLLGLSITKEDRMPQTMCCLCVDKINDFYEFREMCYATNAQTRKLLGLKNIKKPALDIKPKLEIKEESIVPTPIPMPAPASASALNKNNKKRKSDEAALKDEKPDIIPAQPKKKLRFSVSTESNIKEEGPQTKKKLRFSATNEESALPSTCGSKKSKSSTIDDTKLKKEPSPPVAVPATVIPPAVSNKKLRLAAAPQKELAIKKSKQKAGKAAEAEVKEEIKEEVKDEPSATATQPAVKTPQPPKLKFSCNICKERFAAKTSLETHRATHIPKIERYVCTACNEILSKSFDIKNHQLWHKLSKTPYVCGCCGESILNTYAFSRHLREHAFDTPPALLVLDRECPQCHTSYATNFLYNIHVCAVKTRRCAGCNRLQRNDAEYLKHSAQCAKVYLNYSKHIMPSVEALEDAVRIKNENDVEAAAEEMARISGVSLDMAPVVQLTRLSSPLILAASHAVSATGLDDTANISSKKSGKKGVSKKDLRRVDELLKSTLDALVSIKHEPEVHVDQEAPCAAEQSDTDETHDPAGGLDDVHHNNDTDSEDEQRSNYANVDTAINPCTQIDDGAQVKIKQEIDEINEENANKIGGGLKLKIKKEHGQLNSSIIEQQKSSDKRAEKRKKKKKHKEKEKDKQKMSKDTQDEQDINANNNSSEELVGTSTLRIKVEPQDGCDFGENSTAAVLNQRPQPEATIMTSIPMMQFQIACVSSGVEFNNATNPVIESSENHEDEPEDVKPNRQELDRMMKISNVSSGIAMETNEAEENMGEGMDEVGNYNKRSDGEDVDGYHEEGNVEDQHADDNESDHEVDDQSENPGEEQRESANEINNSEGQSVEDTGDNKNNTVTSKTKTSLQAKPKATSKLKENRSSVAPKSRNKACKSTAKPSNNLTLQISAVQSGVTLEPTISTTTDFTPIFIKPEPQNRGYSDEQPQVTSPMGYSEHIGETESLEHAHTEEEQNYISTIDFTNVMIKQEKDIEINDVQITQKSVKSIAKLNGVKRKRKHARDKHLEQNERLENNDDYMGGEENQSDEDDEETDSEEEEEAEEEEDEDDEEVDEEEEHEEREYRELEYPPELDEYKNDNETADDQKDLQEKRKESDDKISFVIANVCSQTSTDNCAEKLTKDMEEGITNDQILECRDTNILLPPNISAINNLEEPQCSNEKVDTVESSDEGFLFNVNVAQENPNSEVPNVATPQETSEDEVKNNENTHSVNTLTSQPSKLSSKDELSSQPGVPFETDGKASEDTQITMETHSHTQYTAQNPETFAGQLLGPETQSHQYVDHILQDIKATISHEPASVGNDFKCNLETNKTENHQGTLLQPTSDVHDSKEQTNLQSTLEHSLETKSALHGLLDNLPYIQCSAEHLQHQPLPTSLQDECARSPAGTNVSSEIEPCLQSHNVSGEISKDNQEEDNTATIEGIVQQAKDADTKAQPVSKHLDNESVENDEEEEENEQVGNEESTTLANNLEECQNYQNQEVLSQIRPTALTLHPYLEDISSSSNSLLSNSLSQTPPPPPQLSASASGVNNNFISQRLLDPEETENILNESNEVTESLATSASQPILGQPLPPHMPTFNFDNINEIAENNNNANIERELQDEHHQQQN